MLRLLEMREDSVHSTEHIRTTTAIFIRTHPFAHQPLLLRSGPSYTITRIDEINSIAGRPCSSGYPVVAAKRELNRTNHQDRHLDMRAVWMSPHNGGPVSPVEEMG